MRQLFDFYLANAKNALKVQFQYRTANVLLLVAMVVEPVVYLVVWSAVASAKGGVVGGYTEAELASYFIVWTLVRNMNAGLLPHAWEGRIRRGQLSAMLLRPIHPLHRDISYFAGLKLVMVVLWLPIAATLFLAFRPTLHPSSHDIIIFAVAIWGAYLLRSVWLTLLGLTTFWTTQATAFFDLYISVELLLSGRLVPISLLPEGLQHLTGFLPFQWAFGYPINVLIGKLTPFEALTGLGYQTFWIVVGTVLLSVVWQRAIRHYSAVGG